MPRIPTFADLGFNDPRAVIQQPQYPATDPAAAALGVAGQGLQNVGTAAFGIAKEEEDNRQAVNEATATADLAGRMIDLHRQISKATDPNQIAQLQSQYSTLLPTSANAIDNPRRKALWMSRHTAAVLQGQADADLRMTQLRRKNYFTDTERLLDDLAEKATDPQSAAVARMAGQGLIEGMSKAGVDPQAVYQTEKRFHHKLDTIEMRSRIHAGAMQALGLAPGASNMSVGGAVPGRIADAAAAIGVDPTTALATAQIESGMGRNLGSRGNIFQLGQTEWAASGGGQMGDQATDIRNGIGFMAKTQNDLREKLGREPQGWEIYLAHQQGVGGATALLNNPDKPAGQVVPPQNIRSNGGDPDAPASDFINKWRDRFTRVASSIGPIQPRKGAADGGSVAVGDSIAAHMVRKGAAAGQESGKVGVYNTGDTAVSGYTPTQVLSKVIPNILDENIKGKNVVLSTGASNNPTQLDFVPEQIKLLKDRGAASVTIMGVGTAQKLAGINDKLAKIANDNGAVFAGPLRYVAGDGIHSSDPKAEFAAAQQATKQSGPAASETPNDVLQVNVARQNRTGLPSEQAIMDHVFSNPLLRTDDEKWAALKVADERYRRMEAEAARAERLQAQADKDAVNNETDRIYSDVYSGNPQITVNDIANNPVFHNDEARRQQMIKLVSDPPGTGIPPGRSWQNAQRLVERIQLPYGDPRKITDPSQIFSELGTMNKDDFNFVKKQLDDVRTDGGQKLAELKKAQIDGTKRFFTRSNPMSNLIDAVGDDRLKQYTLYIDQKVGEYIKAGKDPRDLFLNPKNPDYLSHPDLIAQFQPTKEQSQESVKAWSQGVPQPLPVVVVQPPTEPAPTTETVQQEADAQKAEAKKKKLAEDISQGLAAPPGGMQGDVAFAPIPPPTAPDTQFGSGILGGPMPFGVLGPRQSGETPESYLRRQGL